MLEDKDLDIDLFIDPNSRSIQAQCPPIKVDEAVKEPLQPKLRFTIKPTKAKLKMLKKLKLKQEREIKDLAIRKI